MEMRHIYGQRIPLSLVFAVPKGCTVRAPIILCRAQGCGEKISRSTGRHGWSLCAKGAAELGRLEEWPGKDKESVRNPWKQTRGFEFV